MIIVAIILAAGASSRMGTPKQLLPYAGSTLLSHTCLETFAVFGEQTFVILGANSASIAGTLPDITPRLIVNENWESGMASSVTTGLNAALSVYPALDGVVFLTGDQPYIQSSHLRKLREVFEQGKAGIVASSYADIAGVPAIFHKRIFPELLSLTADTGARYIIQQHQKDFVTVPFPKGEIDIDTPEQYQQLLNTNQ
jgi:molybdenum cofactor cytidylyltransferase